MRRLIVSGDDLGLHPGINAGVVRCHREGIVTSASLCANGGAFEDAVAALRGAPDLDVGVHLTLVGEAPLLPKGSLPTLAPEGRLPPHFGALFLRLTLRRVRMAEVEEEMTAQVARARDAGLRVTHLDSHQHVHLHPALLPAVLRVARRFGIGAVRAAARSVSGSGLRPGLIGLVSKLGSRRLRVAGVRTPDTLVGLAETGRLDEARLRAVVVALPEGTSELVCHPGAGDGAIASAYGWGFRWDEEAAALTAPAVRETLRREGIQLIAYRDL
ncbi:MAG TPA: ChbG/HpnK family deacetylase [Vicinamibacteria bacterium]|nr:ChbG/HpnK family deacetylase [Vicinamibacteria bacterium]